MKKSAVLYVVLFLILIQVFLPYWVPSKSVYHNRMNYQLIVDNVNDTAAAIEQIKVEIDRRKLKDYVILLGDSVMYGSPGNSDQSPGVFMEWYAKQASPDKSPAVFNLAFPAAQLGDMYTMLLWLDKYGISTDHVILNVRYPTFRPRDPDPRSVFWWGEKLRDLDPPSFDRVKDQLEAAWFPVPKGPYEKFKHWLEFDVLPHVKWMNYKDYIHQFLLYKWLPIYGKPVPGDEVPGGDPRPWNVKDNLTAYVQSDEIKADYTDKPFDFSDKSPDMYFMDRIVKHQQGKDTLIVMTGTNRELMKDYFQKPGVQDNQRKIVDYLKGLPVRFVNLDGAISDRLFTDQTHYTPEGYKQLARLIWDAYAQGKGGGRP